MNKQILLAVAVTIVSFPVFAESVTCNGYGADEREAIRDALRNAVEQGVGARIFSETVVKDFVALKDVLISRSFGLVTSYDVLSSSSDREGMWTVRIRAEVTPDVDSKWAEIEVILRQKGYPSVMFYVREFLDGEQIPTYGENAAIQKFKNLGFRVIDRDATLKSLHKMKHGKEDVDALIKMAATRGAHLLIKGVWEGNFNQRVEGPAGLEYLVHSYNLQTRIYRTDTYQVVGATNENFTNSCEALSYNRYNAGRAGFSRAVSSGYLEDIVTDLLKSWITQQQEGDDITLEIANVRYHHGALVAKYLRSLSESIVAVEIGRYQNRHMTLSLKTKAGIHSLAEKLSQIAEFPLEVIAVSKNKLQMRFVEFK